MTTNLAATSGADIIERVITAGDLSKLNAEERTRYYGAVCDSLGLNPLTKPFEFLTLSGKMVLYATRGATDQLRRIHHVSTQIVSRETVGDVYVVTARATDRSGRADESIGAVAIGGKRGDDLCNALMKAETKAKRRATLAIVGLSFLDESEVETIPGVRVVPQDGALDTPAPRGPAIAAAFDAALAEADAIGDEPTQYDQEQPPATDALAAKRAEALDWARQCREAGIKTSDPHPQATEVALEQAIGSYRRMLNNRAAKR